MAYETYQIVTGIITAIQDQSNDCCSKLLTIRGDGQETQSELITMLWRNQSVKLGYFDENLLAGDGSLQLNVDRQVKITTANGQRFSCSPGNEMLLVYYTAVTRSIPPMTTPQRIIVMCP